MSVFELFLVITSLREVLMSISFASKVLFLWMYFFFQPRKWPELNLKSPGIKPRNLPGRNHPPGPLPSMGERHLFPLTARLQEDGEETPRTPLTVSAPHTPPYHGPSPDLCVFAQVLFGPAG